jgi:hypothetical protein
MNKKEKFTRKPIKKGLPALGSPSVIRVGFKPTTFRTGI